MTDDFDGTKAETGPARFDLQPADPERVAERFVAACAGGDIDALVAVLDPNLVGVVDLGDGTSRPAGIGRDAVAPNGLRFSGSAHGVTLVSHPMNGQWRSVESCPDVKSETLLEAAAFFSMDHGWIVTLADPQRSDGQLSLMTYRVSDDFRQRPPMVT